MLCLAPQLVVVANKPDDVIACDDVNEINAVFFRRLFISVYNVKCTHVCYMCKFCASVFHTRVKTFLNLAVLSVHAVI